MELLRVCTCAQVSMGDCLQEPLYTPKSPSPVVGTPHLCTARSQTPPAVNCKHSTRFRVALVESVDAKLTDLEGRMYVH